MATKFNPNSELVATALLKTLQLGPAASFGVGTTLPENLESWKDGFIQVQIVGGSPDIDVPTRRPLVQVDCYVPSIKSSKPQWGRAATIAEDITQFVYEHGESVGTVLSLGNYKDAFVQSVYVASEPRRVSNDPAGHARYTIDLVIVWVSR